MSRQIRTKMIERRRARTRGQLQPSPDRPRLVIGLSNRNVTAQIIGSGGKSLAYSSSLGQKLPPTLSARAAAVGTDIAARAKAADIKKVVLDRSGHRYHGRVKALAEAARTAGLEF